MTLSLLALFTIFFPYLSPKHFSYGPPEPCLRSSGLSLGRLPFSSLPSPGDVVPMVLNLVSSP
jgi:hypothetical protein